MYEPSGAEGDFRDSQKIACTELAKQIAEPVVALEFSRSGGASIRDFDGRINHSEVACVVFAVLCVRTVHIDRSCCGFGGWCGQHRRFGVAGWPYGVAGWPYGVAECGQRRLFGCDLLGMRRA